MNILHISTDENGGAGRAAYNLHKIFKEEAFNSKLLVLNKTINDLDILQYPIGLVKLIYERIVCHFPQKKTDPDYCFYNKTEKKGFVSTSKLLKQLPFKPDIIILYWVSKFINAKNIYELNKFTNAPIFWYGLDMAPLTGGCHYAWDCIGYMNNCSQCPALYSKKDHDVSYKNLLFKERYINKTKITFLACNTFIENQAKQSSLFKNKIAQENIYLPVNPDIFKPTNKKVVRELIGIPQNKFVLLLGSHTIEEKRKGFLYLQEALNLLYSRMTDIEKDNIFIIIIGNKSNRTMDAIPFSNKFLGYYKDDISLALAYQASDVFICSSIEDTGPMMINEAIMCGTPVVAFNIGIATDLVINERTGYKAKLKDSNDLANCILKIISLSNDNYVTMSVNCRNLGIKLLSPKVTLEKIITYFNNVK